MRLAGLHVGEGLSAENELLRFFGLVLYQFIVFRRHLSWTPALTGDFRRGGVTSSVG